MAESEFSGVAFDAALKGLSSQDPDYHILLRVVLMLKITAHAMECLSPETVKATFMQSARCLGLVCANAGHGNEMSDDLRTLENALFENQKGSGDGGEEKGL